jgi:holo-[acyl-carrier protein] synthase
VVAVVTVVTGLDIQPLDEVEVSLSRFGDRYLRRIYTEREVAECESDRHSMASGLAIRFAAKEAVLKALAPYDHIPSWRTIEVLFRSNSVPTVELCGEAELLARQRGVEKMFLSVSLGRGYAVAAVLANVTLDGVAPRSRAEPH